MDSFLFLLCESSNMCIEAIATVRGSNAREDLLCFPRGRTSALDPPCCAASSPVLRTTYSLFAYFHSGRTVPKTRGGSLALNIVYIGSTFANVYFIRIWSRPPRSGAQPAGQGSSAADAFHHVSCHQVRSMNAATSCLLVAATSCLLVAATS